MGLMRILAEVECNPSSMGRAVSGVVCMALTSKEALQKAAPGANGCVRALHAGKCACIMKIIMRYEKR